MGEHLPQRPDWLCRYCGHAWPCESAKPRLLVEYMNAPVSLRLYLEAQYCEASRDLPHAQVGELYDRFTGWLPGPGRREWR